MSTTTLSKTGKSLAFLAFDGSEIPEWIALKLIQTYRIEEGYASYKTRAAWFSIKDLDTILALVKAVNGDGVRIYLGKYPNDMDLPGTPNVIYKTQSRTTLVFVPTLPSSGGKHDNIIDIDELTEPGKVIEPVLTGGFYNHGELEP